MVIESNKSSDDYLDVHILSETMVETSSPPPSPEENDKIFEIRKVEINAANEEINGGQVLQERNKSISELENAEVQVLTSEFKNNSEMVPAENLTVTGAKAYYYSQLSVMLFEKAVTENPGFPEDLDRVHTWFIKDLSEAQKLVCLRELLSLISPSQHRFLFTSVSFDSLQDKDDENVWLDLAIRETQKLLTSPNSKLGALEKETRGNLETRLKTLDLTPGESLFHGMNVISKSKLPLSSTQDSENFPLSLASSTSNSSVDLAPSLTPSASALPLNTTSSNHVAESPAISKDTATSKFSSFISFAPNGELTESLKPTTNPLYGKAPPGFLSPNASEFRPSEPSCYSDVFLSNFTQWLRLLRLHKYSECLKPHYDQCKLGLLEYNESELEQAGVCAMGARRKILRLFERIKEEKNILHF